MYIRFGILTEDADKIKNNHPMQFNGNFLNLLGTLLDTTRYSLSSHFAVSFMACISLTVARQTSMKTIMDRQSDLGQIENVLVESHRLFESER